MQLLIEYSGAIIGVGLITAFLIPALIRQRRESRELDARIRCGPGCICAGENARRYDQQPIHVHAPPQVIYVHQSPSIHVYAVQPEVRYLPARGETAPVRSRYRPERYEAPERIESYYDPYHPEQDLIDYAQAPPRQLSPRNVQYLLPARLSAAEQVRRSEKARKGK